MSGKIVPPTQLQAQQLQRVPQADTHRRTEQVETDDGFWTMEEARAD